MAVAGNRRRVGEAPSAFFGFLLSALLIGLAAVPHPQQEGTAAADLSGYPWLYLRDGQPLPEPEGLVEVAVVGDLMLGRGAALLPDPLGSVAPWLRAADLAVGNFEGALVPGLTEASQRVVREAPDRSAPIQLWVPEAAAGKLARAGFDLLGLANNHTLDRGAEGLVHTIQRLEGAGLGTFGAGPEPEEAWRPLVRAVDGVRMAFLAVNTVPLPGGRPGRWAPATWDLERAARALQSAREEADAVIVLVHWGYEYQRTVDPIQRQVAGQLLALGADLVVGHHPHLVQGTQAVPGDVTDVSRVGFVAYSLGNLVFDQSEGGARHGLALRAFFDRDGLRAVQGLPLAAGGQPRLIAPREAAEMMVSLAPPAWISGCTWEGETCVPVLLPQERRSGIFWSGEIDLTGDGQPERVRRRAGEVTIYHGDHPAWKSPPEWNVLDLALGDPNDDGRYELLLALIKPDSGGVPRSHPFILGYRRGSYRLLWGGSGVSDPIQEVALGDVDGDGVQDLIALEARGGPGEMTLSFWRWHGWGFSLLWRSSPGFYQDLNLTPGTGKPPLIITVARRWGG
jgi:poly-gamma-glutamate synthesis protein (capsule biosynthesis protein)